MRGNVNKDTVESVTKTTFDIKVPFSETVIRLRQKDGVQHGGGRDRHTAYKLGECTGYRSRSDNQTVSDETDLYLEKADFIKKLKKVNSACSIRVDHEKVTKEQLEHVLDAIKGLPKLDKG